MTAPFRVLTLSGSLRKASLNTAMLTVVADCAPPGLRMTRHRRLGDLPLFNPDLELHDPSSVARLRNEIAMADAVIIASPEYALGVSGVMKNALDWMWRAVSSSTSPWSSGMPHAVHRLRWRRHWSSGRRAWRIRPPWRC